MVTGVGFGRGVGLFGTTFGFGFATGRGVGLGEGRLRRRAFDTAGRFRADVAVPRTPGFCFFACAAAEPVSGRSAPAKQTTKIPATALRKFIPDLFLSVFMEQANWRGSSHLLGAALSR
jgi:hypothetical protein